MTYKATQFPGIVIDLSDGASVPIDGGSWRSVQYREWLESGNALVPLDGLTFDEYCITIANGVTSWLSSYVNKTYGYDEIVSAASYAGDKNSRFNAEGTAARDWRSDCFIALYAGMPSYSAMTPDQWPTLDYITAHLPQPSAYQWEPAS